jgi:hypothetical protein
VADPCPHCGVDVNDLTAEFEKLWEAAACVANAIRVGAGSMVRDSLAEKELRDALGLKGAELVEIPKRAADRETASHD